MYGDSRKPCLTSFWYPGYSSQFRVGSAHMTPFELHQCCGPATCSVGLGGVVGAAAAVPVKWFTATSDSAATSAVQPVARSRFTVTSPGRRSSGAPGSQLLALWDDKGLEVANRTRDGGFTRTITRNGHRCR